MKNRRGTKRAAIKGNVLICGKDEREGKVTVWVLANPEIRAEAVSFAAAEEQLLDKIWSLYELDEPVGLRYQDEGSASAAIEGSLFEIAPNETVDASNPGQYFNEGFCSTCQSGKGGRNGETLRLDHVPRGTTSGLMVRFQPYFRCGLRVGMHLLHASLCDEIMEECDPLVEFRAVGFKRRQGSSYREVIPTQVFPCVIPATRRGRLGGVCCECGTAFIYHEPKKLFVRRSDADVIRQHGVVAIDTNSRPLLCVTAKVWNIIGKSKAGQGLLVNCSVTGLDEEEILRKPKLERIVPLRSR